ncbi:MAG: hypothetical protein B6A08_05450 [Sorangiineae bacterium NIC37A_2]|nr:MAG: hypothetical protein B6A08_05450 [Sorangiineae bacterium NIC37A_2]
MKRFLPFLAFPVVILANCSPNDGTSGPMQPGASGGAGVTGPTGGSGMSASGSAPGQGSGGMNGEGAGSTVDPGAGGGGSGGAAPGTGGAEGTGGARVVQDLPWGFRPESVGLEDAREAYEVWKEIHLEDCGDGAHRVRWENAKLDATVSEGIGYGMLLTVAFDDREAFDGLLAYSKRMRVEGRALMHWLRYGCDAHWDTKYNDYPDNAASDGDLDVAMALIQASCRWGDNKYLEEAKPVIKDTKEHMFMEDNGKLVLQPGDSSWFDMMGGGCVNYSYFAPAYYREFAKVTPEDADFWNRAADDSYPLLAAASHPETGLVRNWGSAGGGDATAGCHNAYIRSASYGDDAARTPWRIAVDYLWHGKTEAKAWNDKVTNWVKSVGIKNTVQWYNLDGSTDDEAPSPEDHTAINVGPFAVGAMTLDPETVESFAAELVAIPAGEGDHDGEYFPRMLKALSLLALAGKFDTCGGK